MATTLAELSVLIGADVSGLEAGMKQAETSVGGFSTKLTSIAAGVAAAAASLGALGVSAVKSAGDIQALEKGFAATYKGSEALSVALAKVKDLAKLPGLGLKEALQGATNLQAAGFSADLATRALGAFGNALATVGKGKADLDGVGLALSQIASKGKISAEEINQLAERVPQIRAAMTAAFGTADTQALQKAKISATDFVEGVTRELEKLPKVTGGLNNAFENFSDASTIALSKLGFALNNAFDIEGAVNTATDALNSVGDAIEGLEPQFKAVAAYFGKGGEGGELFGVLAESVSNAATEIKGAFDALNGGQKSLSFLKDLVRELAVGFTALSDVVGGTIGTITRALKTDFVGAEKEAQRALFGIIDPLANLLGFTKKASTEIGANLKDAFDPLADAPDYFADIAVAVTKVAGLTAEQQKALDKLRKQLLDNENASRALGETYDFLGNKAKILQSGIVSLTDVGFAPAGKVVKGYVAQLRGVPEAIDQIAARVAKGVEKLNAVPEFKLKLPDKVALPETLALSDTKYADGDAPELPDYGAKFALAAKQVAAGGAGLQAAFQSTLQPVKQSVLDFNTNIEAAFDQLGASIGPLIATIAQDAADAFGSFLVGTASAGDAITAALGGILQALGGFMSDFGKQLITIGIGKLALDTLFAGPQGGPLAIAAGVGLIALAGVVSAVGKNASASLSSIGSGGSSLGSSPKTSYGSSAATSSQPPIKIVAEFKLRGQDLVAVARTNDYRVQRTN